MGSNSTVRLFTPCAEATVPLRKRNLPGKPERKIEASGNIQTGDIEPYMPEGLERHNLARLSCFAHSARSVKIESGVVFSHRREDIEHLGFLEGPCLMLDTARNQKRISGLRFKRPTWMFEPDRALNDINQLLVGMAVSGAHPTLFHCVSNKHHGWAERHYLPL